MKYNRNYTFALMVLIGILAVGSGVYFVRKNASKIDSTYNPTTQITPSTDTNTDTSTGKNKDTLQVKSIPITNQTPKKQEILPIKTCSGNGIAITIIDQPAYECNTGDASVAMGGHGGGTVELSALYKKDSASGGLVIVAVDKFSKQSFFDEVASVAEDSHSQYSLISSNYKISGVIGSYYTRENGDGLIIIPSKLIIISTELASVVGIPQTTLDFILSSITF